MVITVFIWVPAIIHQHGFCYSESESLRDRLGSTNFRTVIFLFKPRYVRHASSAAALISSSECLPFHTSSSSILFDNI